MHKKCSLLFFVVCLCCGKNIQPWRARVKAKKILIGTSATKRKLNRLTFSLAGLGCEVERNYTTGATQQKGHSLNN